MEIFYFIQLVYHVSSCDFAKTVSYTYFPNEEGPVIDKPSLFVLLFVSYLGANGLISPIPEMNVNHNPRA